MSVMLQSVFVILWMLNFRTGACQTCINVAGGGDDYCREEAEVGECWFNPTLHCTCSLACLDAAKCPNLTDSIDTDCLCLFFASNCLVFSGMCPTTCDRRDNVICDPLPSIPNASPSLTTPFYGDKVTFTCDEGYIQTGGQEGLRVCITNGTWIVSNKTGANPVCEGPPCNAPPDLPRLEPSSTNGSYPDAVTYSCGAGYERLGGGTSRHKCSLNGTWEMDPLDTPPICLESTHRYRKVGSSIPSNLAVSVSTRITRSGLECARYCSISVQCSGYTYTQQNLTCLLNHGLPLPIITDMKRLYQ